MAKCFQSILGDRSAINGSLSHFNMASDLKEDTLPGSIDIKEMANVCFTDYVLVGSKEKLDFMQKVMEDLNALEKPLVENDFGNLWMGCILTRLGIDWTTVPCRGKVTSFQRVEDGRMEVEVESAWEDLDEAWLAIRHKLVHVRIFYFAQETSSEYLRTNDVEGRYFPCRFVLDFSNERKNVFLQEGFSSIGQVVKFINDNGLLGKPVLRETLYDVQEALDEYWALHEEEDLTCNLMEVEVVSDALSGVF